MKGGFLVALDNGLHRRASAALVELGAVLGEPVPGGRVTQLADESERLFTLYEGVPEGTEWEFRDGIFMAARGVSLPDMRVVIACPFECRWPDLVARLANVVARTAERPTWVLDGDGVLWDAEDVDPLLVTL